MASIRPAGPPGTYFGIAVSLMVGIRVLASDAEARGIPLAMLSAHALECMLKAYLSRDGDDAALRGGRIRHDLYGLWEKAVAEGLRIKTVAPAWVSTLGKLHGHPYRLRYSTGVHGLVLPPADQMVSDLETILKQVRAQLATPRASCP
jgi:hypothetical protein